MIEIFFLTYIHSYTYLCLFSVVKFKNNIFIILSKKYFSKSLFLFNTLNEMKCIKLVRGTSLTRHENRGTAMGRMLTVRVWTWVYN